MEDEQSQNSGSSDSIRNLTIESSSLDELAQESTSDEAVPENSDSEPVHIRNLNVKSSSLEMLARESTSDLAIPENSDSEPAHSRFSMVVETAKSVNEEVFKKLAELEISCGPKSPISEESSLETVSSVLKQSHQLKWITWKGKRTAIVTQNENGPCPLIAIANILLLRGKVILPADVTEVSASDLLDCIGDAIIDYVPEDLETATVLNYEQNMHDAITVLPHLPHGLDVNVKFTGVRDFEYTPECVLFDLLDIPLYHGWLVDPQSEETVVALGNFGYNEIVERIIANKSSSDPNLLAEAMIAEEFLERTASQLTYHGLCELSSTMEPNELAVLFRNNHFSTVLKRMDELFLLVTDQGFLNEPRVVWETLCSIDGDGQFVDSFFVNVPPILSDTYLPVEGITEDQQISHDYLVALSLQEDQKQQQQQHENKEQAWEEFRQALPVTDDISDYLVALSLQEDQKQQQQQQHENKEQAWEEFRQALPVTDDISEPNISRVIAV